MLDFTAELATGSLSHRWRSFSLLRYASTGCRRSSTNFQNSSRHIYNCTKGHLQILRALAKYLCVAIEQNYSVLLTRRYLKYDNICNLWRPHLTDPYMLKQLVLGSRHESLRQSPDLKPILNRSELQNTIIIPTSLSFLIHSRIARI
jgi:hypothetical protein